jgi:ABC-2 type transport system permease protein
MTQAIHSGTGGGASAGLWPGAAALWHREMVRFFRQKNRVASAFVTPLLLWVGLGAGLDRAFVTGADAAGGTGYMAYFFPGTLSMIVLFTAIFSSISVIEDRREGFMQGVLVAPVPRLSIVLGKVLGGASIAMIQALLFLLLWPVVGGFPGFGAALSAAGVLAVMSVALSAAGLCIAWPMNSTAGFHAVMMLLLMPMWFLSGAVFPVATAMPWLRVPMWSNPMTYGQSVLSRALLGHDAVRTGLPVWGDVVLMLLFVLAVLALAATVVGRPRRDGA